MYLKKALFLVPILLGLWCSNSFGEPLKDKTFPKEKTKERLQMIKMWRLTEVLKLDQDSAARFFALDNHFEETKNRIRKDMHEDVQRLRSIMRDSYPPERELRELVTRLKNRKKDLDEVSQRQINDEMNLLRLDQQAQYILFQIDFRREMEDILRGAREEKWPRPAPEYPPERLR